MKKILIVVDPLNDFLLSDGKLYCGPTVEAIIPGMREKLNDYMEKGDDIIFLADAHAEDDKEFEKFPPHCIAGTEGAKVHEDLDLALHMYGNTFLVEKTRYSGFYGTNLSDILKYKRPDLVEVIGLCTSICVMDTVGGLANRDIKINVYKDIVADFDQEMHEMALKRMESLYGANIV